MDEEVLETFYFGGPDVFDGFDEETKIDSFDSVDEVPDKITIPLFREGVWHYPRTVKEKVTGKQKTVNSLNVDKEFLHNLVENTNNGAYPHRIHGNADHGKSGDKRAKAWLVPGSLFMKRIKFTNKFGEHERECVFGTVELNKAGKQIIADKEFRYISAEMVPNFSTREYFPSKTRFGNIKQKRVPVGPVFTGFAFTNKPKIDNMPALFSEDAEYENVEVVDFEEESELPGNLFTLNFSEEVEEQPNETQPETEEPSPAQEITFSEKENNMDLVNVMVELGKLTTNKEKVEYLEALSVGTEMDFSEGDVDAIASLTNTYSEFAAAEERAANTARKLALKEAQIVQLNDKVEELKLSEAASAEVAYSAEVDLFVQKHVAEGITPAVGAVAKRILMAVPVESREMKFSEGSDDEADFDLMGAMEMLFSEMPKVELGNEVLEGDASVVEVTPDPTPEAPTPEPAPELNFSEDEPELNIPEKVKLFAKNYNQDAAKIAAQPDYVARISEDGFLIKSN